MNKIERLVYDVVKKNPAVKYLLRNAYQGFYDLLPHPANWSLNEIHYKEDYFYGFHDCSPFSADETKLLAYHTTIPVRMPLADEALQIGYFDLSSDGSMNDYHVIGESWAWNYHKGCRLQWVDENTVIYNTAVDGKACAVLADLQGEEIARLSVPIDTLSKDGKYATSFNYERLNELMPGYGYEHCCGNGFLDVNAPEETGLFLVEIATQQVSMLLSLKELASSVDEEGVMQSRHYVTHSEFSSDGRYVSFLHRWIEQDYRKRHSRLVVYDLQTKEWFALPTTGMVSHYIWNDKHQIVAYCSVKEVDGHVCFQIPQGSYTLIMPHVLNDDGHQTMVSDTIFVTDTYPDKRRMASLYRVDMQSQSREKIAYLYSPKEFQTQDFHKHIACDLHPRVSPSRRFVCFDAAFSSKRSLCVMQLTEKSKD